MTEEFVIARNPDASSSLPFVVRLPLEGGVWLKVRETWPRSSRVYCHPCEPIELETLEVLERAAVISCVRRGPAVDLILNRAQSRRAQFVFTSARGRPMIFWQTAKSAQNARPGLRVPYRTARRLDRIVVDTREKYGYRFNGRDVTVARAALRAGDYAAFLGESAVATIERKTLEDFAHSLGDGTLALALADLARLPAAAVVVEGSYSKLLRLEHANGNWLGILLTRLQARYAAVPIVFVETRALGERWAFDFFLAVAAENDPQALPLSALVVAEAPPLVAPAKRGRPKKVAQLSEG